jgi:hypothetical protein
MPSRSIRLCGAFYLCCPQKVQRGIRRSDKFIFEVRFFFQLPVRVVVYAEFSFLQLCIIRQTFSAPLAIPSQREAGERYLLLSVLWFGRSMGSINPINPINSSNFTNHGALHLQ